MFEIGWTELLVVAIVAIIVVGPKELPRMLRTFGGMLGKMRRMAGEFQSQFNEVLREAERQADLDDVKKHVEAARKFDPLKDVRESLTNAVSTPAVPAAATPAVAGPAAAETPPAPASPVPPSPVSPVPPVVAPAAAADPTFVPAPSPSPSPAPAPAPAPTAEPIPAAPAPVTPPAETPPAVAAPPLPAAEVAPPVAPEAPKPASGGGAA